MRSTLSMESILTTLDLVKKKGTKPVTGFTKTKAFTSNLYKMLIYNKLFQIHFIILSNL